MDTGAASFREAALEAARRGWSVFPCRPGGKTPAVPGHKEQDCDGLDPWCRNGHAGWEPRATADTGRISRGWAHVPCNIGVACGPSGLVVLDLDAHGELPAEWQLPGVVDGKDVFAQICSWAGMGWPSTYTVETPSGGWHLYFTALPDSGIRNSASLIGPQVDVRANGGYVVGAGSVVNGKAYEVLHDGEPAPLPAWIARLLMPPAEKTRRAQFVPSGRPGKRLEGLLRTVVGAKPGTRNDTLNWAAWTAREIVAAGQADEREVAGQLLAAAVSAGLPEAEAARTIASAMRGTR